MIAGLCKGSTTDSDSVCEGSNPSPAARIRQDLSTATLCSGPVVFPGGIPLWPPAQSLRRHFV